ncbi:hypothetical protein [Scopulibacillus cellulosilyticus]|uniref:Uncharacterized protein n=1 Tax=Scopulibacillus cellulosilyticus TaxID=2665665 RepID=A0ABW2Q120_9BACL
MIVISLNDLNIKSMSDNSGVFFGSNFEPNWDVFTKSNTNISGNTNNNNLNLIIDKDGLDFVITNEQNAKQIVIKDDPETNQITISKLKTYPKSSNSNTKTKKAGEAKKSVKTKTKKLKNKTKKNKKSERKS